MSERLAIYPGSFDPITNGHVGIIRRSLRIFDRVLVAVLRNISKDPLFDLDERIAMIHGTFEGEGRIDVDAFDGLLVAYAQQKGAVAIVRGLRAVADFEYELQMCNMNRRLAPDVTMIYLMAEDRHAYISSSLIKEVVRLGGDVRGLVPDHVEARLREVYSDVPERQ